MCNTYPLRSWIHETFFRIWLNYNSSWAVFSRRFTWKNVSRVARDLQQTQLLRRQLISTRNASQYPRRCLIIYIISGAYLIHQEDLVRFPRLYFCIPRYFSQLSAYRIVHYRQNKLPNSFLRLSRVRAITTLRN